MTNISVLKTYKIFIDGAFPRTESGRYYKLNNKQGEIIANMCLSSRKDFRNAVTAARKAHESWAARVPFNKSQIIYRIAEMLEGRRTQFVEELILQGVTKSDAEKEVQQSIDRCVYYSGWCDKFQMLTSSVNPVSSNHFNFSVAESMGVVSIIAPEKYGLLGLLSIILPCIIGGNTVIVLASESLPICAITWAEVLATSDMPAGVINILTGQAKELHTHMSTHMDVNAVIYAGDDKTVWTTIAKNASLNLKRIYHWNNNWNLSSSANPYLIFDLQEIKTTWHPIEQISTSGAKY
jgi:acyl-CoA reductase-like NAD-dependent aldehyde dehydrogenase